MGDATPAIEYGAGSNGKTETRSVRTASMGGHVLVVDDDRDTADLLREGLN